MERRHKGDLTEAFLNFFQHHNITNWNFHVFINRKLRRLIRASKQYRWYCRVLVGCQRAQPIMTSSRMRGKDSFTKSYFFNFKCKED
jgi:hypothetical protein